MRTIVKAGLLATLAMLGTKAWAQDDQSTSSPVQHGAREMGTSARGILQSPRDYFSVRNLTVWGGAGFSDFSEQGTDLLTRTGGSWIVRGMFGADQAIGMEGAYVGAAYPLRALNGDGGSLISNGLEALGRVGYPIRRDWGFLLPYVTTGLGFTIFNAVNVNEAASGIGGSDVVFNIPVGFGMGAGFGRWNFDARFLFRPGWGSTMFDNAGTGNLSHGDNTLALSGLVGYHF
jgi:hypothetical protein